MIDEGIRALEIKPAVISSMMDEVRETGFLNIKDFPLPDGSTVALELREAKPFAPGARFVRQSSTDPSTARTQPVTTPDGALILTGRVAGEEHSFAMLALSDKGSFGMIESAKGRAIISSGKLGARLEPVIYDPKSALGGILEMTDWICETDIGDAVFEAPVPRRHNEGGIAGDPLTCKVVSLALEYDYEFWNNSLGADAWTAMFYTLALVASLDEIYRRDTGVGIQLSNLRVWDEVDDPWTGANTLDQLDELIDWYGDNGADVERDTVMLCSGRNIGGGRANIEALCNDDGFAVSGSMNGFFPYPLEESHASNWDIYVVAHELGHNLGAVHTHEFCPPLDQCAPADFFGGCQDAQVCGDGTLMSYCHTCVGGVGNVHMGFHETVAQAIADYVGGSECVLDGDPAIDTGNDFADTLMNTRVRIDVLQNDTATCSEVIIFSFDEVTAAGGSVERSVGSGLFGRDELIYQPPAGFTGDDSFSYMAMNEFATIDLGPVSIDVTPQVQTADLLVADVIGNAIHRYDAVTGEFLGTLVPANEGGLDLPQKACLGPGGDLLVANYKTDHVLRFNPVTGESLGVFFGGDLIDAPNDLAFDFNTVYVSAKDADQVVMVKASGFVGFILDVGHSPNQILLRDPENLLLVAYGSSGAENGVQIWDTQTKQIADQFLTPQLEHASAICRLPDGDLLVGDWFGMQIGRYDGDTFAFEGWFLDWAAAQQLGVQQPNRIVLGPNGRVHVTSSTGIHRFNANGQYIDQIDESNSELLTYPRGMFFRPSGAAVGDLNGDGIVDGADLATLLGDWGGPGAGDLNGDGVVDGADLAILLGNWG